MNALPMLGRRENAKNHLSQCWEDEKTRKIAFPNVGKNEKRKKMAVPTLGKLKNSEKQLSQVWENQKTPKTALPTPWKAKKR